MMGLPPLCLYCILLQFPLAIMNLPKVLVPTTQFDSIMGKHVRAYGNMERVDPWEFFLQLQYSASVFEVCNFYCRIFFKWKITVQTKYFDVRLLNDKSL
jgi:hypothetical protein